jgi:tRNA threonylcarbamoyladenosine biosynthesis protein TsaE
MNRASHRLLGKFPGILSPSPLATSKIGEALAQGLYPGLSVLLSGDLGAGKTALARSMGEPLGVSGMKSPTFAIEAVHDVPGKGFSLVHCDLYRISCDDDAVFMSLEERIADGDALLIEWGELWQSPPDADRWDINISILGEGSRMFELSAYGDRALSALGEAYCRILDIFLIFLKEASL